MRVSSVFLAVFLAYGASAACAGSGMGSRELEGKSSRLKPLLQKRPLPQQSKPVRMLVFTRTQGFRHDSIPDAVRALRELAATQGWQTDHGEDAAAFTSGNLSRYEVVVFANTTGDVFDEAQQRALRAFVENGGGFVGLHSAADTEYGWPWYGELVGAWFASHPPGLQTAEVRFEGSSPVRGEPWRATDELYNYRSNPRANVRVIARVDERGYAGGTMGRDHPIAWCRPVGKGRSWYTGLGHAKAMYAEPTFRAHVLRGLRFAAGLSGDC